MRKQCDYYLYKCIVAYFYGIIILVLFSAAFYLLKKRQMNPLIPMLWATLFPFYLLVGLFLYQIEVWEGRLDYLYVIALSIVSMLVIYWYTNTKSIELLSNKVFWTVLVSLYLLIIVTIIIPNRTKKKWFLPNRIERVVEITEHDMAIHISPFRGHSCSRPLTFDLRH